MIQITYEQGEVSLLSACAAAKTLIQHRDVGTCCRVSQTSAKMTVHMTFTLELNGTVSETTDMELHAPSK